MNKLFIAGSALILSGIVTSAMAAPLDEATRQQVYTTAYQNLAQEQHNCQSAPCGSAIPSAKVESIFNTAYAQVTGKQPGYQDYLEWKYLSDFPAGATASDVHFPQASNRNLQQNSAAVKEAPASMPADEERIEPGNNKPSCQGK